MTITTTRRRFIKGGSIALGHAALGFPMISFANARPTQDFGVQSDDVTPNSAMIWSRASKPSKMWVEIATTPDFSDKKLLPGPNALPETDFTGKIKVTDLAPRKAHYYRVFFQDFDNGRAMSEGVHGQFTTAPDAKSDIRFAWSGDTAGQGWGINLDDGGMKAYSTVAEHQPHFFINSGDCVYADGPISETVELPDGSIWKTS